jgi:hypothetical protein
LSDIATLPGEPTTLTTRRWRCRRDGEYVDASRISPGGIVLVVKVVVGLAIVMGAGFGAGGVYELHQATHGEKVSVLVTDCHYVSSGTNGTEECNGSWVEGGSLVGGNGHVVLGPANNVNSNDIGKHVTMRAHGGSAYAQSVRLPIILFVIAFLALAYGAYFVYAAWTGKAYGPKTREVVMARRAAKKAAKGAPAS